MTEEQLARLIETALIESPYSCVSASLVRETRDKAIELAKERGLLTSTDSAVMWDKNEPYGAATTHDQCVCPVCTSKLITIPCSYVNDEGQQCLSVVHGPDHPHFFG